jgi:hypothetical protein
VTAVVKENNLKTSIKDRFDKNKPPPALGTIQPSEKEKAV